MKVIILDGSLRREHNTVLQRDVIKKTLIELITIAVKFFKVREKVPSICIFGREDRFKLVTPVQEEYVPVPH